MKADLPAYRDKVFYDPDEYGNIAQITRVEQDNGSEATLRIKNIMPTSSFVFQLKNILKENLTLKNIVSNLWETYLYNQEYFSYLSGAYTKEEFMEIAEKYAVPFDTDVDDDEIFFATNLIFSIIDRPLTSSDLGVMINADCSKIEYVLTKTSENISNTSKVQFDNDK